MGIDYGELEKLFDRVAAIEARQRAQAIHDPGCRGATRSHPSYCDCWLSRSPADPPDRPGPGKGNARRLESVRGF